MAIVRLDRVSKTYANGVEAVRDISLVTGDGELLVLVGPSGCGKSTTLRMIAGLEAVSAGEVFIGERRVTDLPPRDRDIAMVFQNYALYPHMSVYENLAFGLKLRKLPKSAIDERVRRAAATLGITAELDRRPANLSGGQRQRVAVGRAIVREPQVFLFDEPLSNLDARLRVQTRKEIARLHRQLGTTMVYVTHDQVEAMTLGDRIVVMDGGVALQADAPLAVYDHPANRFVAGFIGNPPMNFVEGTLVREEGAAFISADGSLRLHPPTLPFVWTDGMHVTLGIRPEHITIAGDDHDGISTITMQLDLVESMGNEIIVYATKHTLELVARLPPRALPVPGSAVRLVLDASRFHFFDDATGVALT